jgi:Domain of unknown function (DUF4360)
VIKDRARAASSLSGVISAALLVSASPASAAPPGSVPTGTITIESVTANGSSCRPGTTAVAISPDNQAFTVTYSAYVAQTGHGAKPSDAHQKCKLTVTVHTPAGYTFAVTQVQYRGFAEVAPGATATQRGSFSLQGDNTSTEVTRTIRGEFSDDWQTDSAASTLVYVPCGKQRKLDVTTELTVDPGTSDTAKSSWIAMDSTDGSIESTYHLAWKNC